MAAKKQYASPEVYEKKLVKVMERFGAESHNYDWSRHAAWVEFTLSGQLYRFDHSVEKAKSKGFDLTYGSDVFAQIVLSLEDLARMAERGIYEIQTWLAGMKFLPPPVVVPECFKALGFTEPPATVEDVKARFKGLAKQCHPDSGGSKEAFVALQEAAQECVRRMEAQDGTE